MNAYLDNAATTKPCVAAVAAMTEAITDNWGNPSAVHHLGFQAEMAVKQARRQVAAALGCEQRDLFFTSGGTEGDNFAILSPVQKLEKRGRHIVTTAIEHAAVLEPCKALKERGFSVTYLAPQPDGTVTAEQVAAAMRPDTILVSVMQVNNETGAVMDIPAIARVVHRHPDALFHTDAVQGFLKVPFRASSLGADLVTVSGHKIQGPKGVGAVYVRPGVHLPPLLCGGGQEGGMRSGTENVPAICGFGAACSAARQGLPVKLKLMAELKSRCLDQLQAQVPEAQILGAGAAPHILTLAVPGVRSQGLINALQERGVYVSAGSACSKGHRSHVLEAMGVEPALIDGAIRVSTCYDTTAEEIDLFLSALREAVDRLR